MTTRMDDNDYLWDRTGEPDADVVRLESVLAPLRHRADPPPLPQRVPRRAGLRPVAWMATAAAVLLAIAAGWYVVTTPGNAWNVQTLAGQPVVEGSAKPDDPARLAVGEWLVTDAVSRARLSVDLIGQVDMEPNTRLQLVTARGGEHRMSLARGTIHARIWAPPKYFFVNTPSATAIDLGCEYSLQVDDSGAGLIRVTKGWVAFESGGRMAYVPENAMCATRPGTGPGTPRYVDAPAGYSEALSVLDFAAADDPRRPASLDLILSMARPRDALTLWHLLARGSATERSNVFDRLNEIVPAPPGVTRAQVLAGDRRALDQWWSALGMDDAAWSRAMKKKIR